MESSCSVHTGINSYKLFLKKSVLLFFQKTVNLIHQHWLLDGANKPEKHCWFFFFVNGPHPKITLS